MVITPTVRTRLSAYIAARRGRREDANYLSHSALINFLNKSVKISILL